MTLCYLTNSDEMTALEKAWFKFMADKLKDATPDEICSYYVQNFVFKNEGWLTEMMRKHKLPSDFLKLHKKITKIARELA